MAKMNKQARQITILTVVLSLIVLLAVIKGAFRSGPEGLVEEVGLEELAPAGLSASDVERIELYVHGAEKEKDEPEKVVLVRDDKGWTVASHYNAPCDETKVDELMETLAGLEGEFRSDQREVLGDYELDNPSALHVVLLKSDGSSLLHLLAGKRTRYDRSFVRRSGEDTVFEVDTNVRGKAGLWGTGKEPPSQSYWLDKTPVEVERDRIEKIALAWPERSLVLEKTMPEEPESEKEKGEETEEAEESEEGEEAEEKVEPEWVVREGGMGLSYKSGATEEILKALEDLQVDDALDPSRKKDFGLDENAPYRCELTLDDGQTILLLGALGDEVNDRILTASTREGMLYKLTKGRFGRLFKQGRDLFDVPGPEIDEDKLTRFSVRSDVGELVFEKKEDEWVMVTPETKHPLKSDAPGNLLNSLGTLTPEDVVRQGDAAARGLEPPKHLLTYTTADGTTHSIKFGNKPDWAEGPYAVLDDQKDLVTIVRQSTVDRLFPEVTRFIEPRVFPDLDEPDIASVTVSGTENDFAVRRKEEEWVVASGGAEKPGKKDEIEDWLGRLADLQATEISIREEPIEVVAGEIKVETEKGESFVLHLAKVEDGKRSVRRTDRKLTFIVRESEGNPLVPDPAGLQKEKAPEEAAPEAAGAEEAQPKAQEADAEAPVQVK